MPEPITAEQCRAARAMLRITQDELAVAAGLTPRIIQNVEASRGALDGRRKAVARCLAVAFTAAGVEFTDNGQGVRIGTGGDR